MSTSDPKSMETVTAKAHPVIKSYKSTNPEVKNLRPSKLVLPILSRFDGNESGVAVTSYGQGQVSGVMYTVPAHGEINVDFKLKMLCVTPADIQNLSDLLRSLLDVSHQHSYDELEKTSISGGASFFGFFGWGGVSASYEKTKHTMDSFGLSEKNQQTIVAAMMNVSQQVSEFNYLGKILNANYDYDVSGSVFGIVMDATIQQDAYQHQLRFLAPQPHLRTNDGDNLPVTGRFY